MRGHLWGRRRATLPVVLGAALMMTGAGAALAKDDHVDLAKELPAGQVEDGKALIYVVRPARVGFAIKSFFLCDREILGINKGRSYFFAQVDPGRHVFWSKSENVDALEMEVEAGRTYYIEQKVQMGGFRARTKLVALDEAEGKAALAKCTKHATMTEEGRRKGMEIAEEHFKDTREDLERRAKQAEKESSG